MAHGQGTAPAAGAMRPFRSDSEFIRTFRELTASDDRAYCSGTLSVRSDVVMPADREAAAREQLPALIHGRVSGIGGQPPLYASLFIEGTGIGANTDSAGRYVIRVPPAQLQAGKSLTVVQRAMGYRSVKREITGLIPGASVELDVSICPVQRRAWDYIHTGANDASLS